MFTELEMRGSELMLNLPSAELLELRHAFPCTYTFKVIGFADANFTARVIACVRDELQLEQDPPYTCLLYPSDAGCEKMG